MPYHRIPMMMQLYRHLWRKQPSIWAIRMYVAVRPRPQVLTVLVLCAGYLPTAAYTICHEQPHRAFMTSVLRYQRQMQRQGTLYFLQEPIMQDVRFHTLVSTVETVRWCIAVIQFSTHQSILLTGRAISMVLED